jgi:hypothetical protein
MLFVLLITGCVLAAGTLLLFAREMVVKMAGIFLLMAVFLTDLWLWVLSGTKAARPLMEALALDKGDDFVCPFIFVTVTVAFGWIWFLVCLRRQQQEEYSTLSSVGRPSEPPDETQELDWRQPPPPRGDT